MPATSLCKNKTPNSGKQGSFYLSCQGILLLLILTFTFPVRKYSGHYLDTGWEEIEGVYWEYEEIEKDDTGRRVCVREGEQQKRRERSRMEERDRLVPGRTVWNCELINAKADPLANEVCLNGAFCRAITSPLSCIFWLCTWARLQALASLIGIMYLF